MKAIWKTLPILVVAGGLFAALAILLALGPSGWGLGAAHADPPVLVALDMNPAGNSCPGDGMNDCTLGPIDSCVSAAAGAAITFDVVVDDLPPSTGGIDGLASLDFQLLWGGSVVPAEADVIDITDRADISGTIHLLQQAAGSNAQQWDPQPLPVLAPPYIGSYVDWGGAGGVWGDEPNPPWTQGTVGRYTATVSASTPPGLYKLEFDPDPIVTAVGNIIPYDACDVGPGCTLQNAIVAVDQPCLAPTPPPTPVPGPANDDFDNATVIPGLPFADQVDTRSATTAIDDPDCHGRGPTVWYVFVPAQNMRVEANTFGSNYDTTLSVYTGSRGALSQWGCNDDTDGLQSQVIFDAIAGEAYFFMVGAWANGPGGDLTFSVNVAPPPLEVGLSIDPVGQVIAKTGVVTIGGTVTCSKAASVELFGELEQRAGRVVIHGWFFESLVCADETPWSATVVGEDGLFKAGAAHVSVTGVAFAGEESDYAEASATVRLKGSRPPR
jgi:hypothetical protein